LAASQKSNVPVFIDANIFLHVVLGTGKEAAACTRFLEDADAGLFPCATSVIVLNEVLHRLLIGVFSPLNVCDLPVMIEEKEH